MEQKLQKLLYSLPTRTAWIIIGGCVGFWLVCLTGILIPPVSAPPQLTLPWFYLMLMLILASGIAVIGAAAVLVLKRGARVQPAIPAPPSGAEPGADAPVPAPQPPAAAERLPRSSEAAAAATGDEGGQDQLAGLGRMLDNPGNLPNPGDAAAANVPGAAAPLRVTERKAKKRKARKRRR